jgi:hypothetical protein
MPRRIISPAPLRMMSALVDNSGYVPSHPLRGATGLAPAGTPAGSRPRGGYELSGTKAQGRPRGGYSVAGTLSAIRAQHRPAP